MSSRSRVVCLQHLLHHAPSRTPLPSPAAHLGGCLYLSGLAGGSSAPGGVYAAQTHQPPPAVCPHRWTCRTQQHVKYANMDVRPVGWQEHGIKGIDHSCTNRKGL
jgi:hypothetical protein